jgi:acyl carrier protein
MEKKFLELFAEIIEAEETLDLGMVLSDLDGWDSLAILSMISMVEDEFGVVIGQKDLKSMVTIGDIFNFINKSLN